ncbi:MAG: DcaP family trimeric outer membrane transporter [Pseudohaliea sp.]
MNRRTSKGLSVAVLLAGSSLAGAADLETRIAALEAQLAELKAAVAEEQGTTGPPPRQGSAAPAVEPALETLTIGQDAIEETLALSHIMKRDDTWFRYGGYMQLDTLVSSYSDGKPAALMEDFLVPSLIPVEPVSGGSDSYQSTNMHAKSSRFWFGTETDTDAGRIRSHIELDFILSAQGDERVSNSFSARIRHAYVDWQYAPGQSLMAGQNWSTFFDVGALPDLLDFVGPVGTIFERQPQLRWTSGNLQFALENATTRLSLPGGGSRIDDGETLPDIVARYNGKSGDLRWSVAGIARQLDYEARDGAVEQGSDSTLGYGASLSGKWQLGSDDLRFMASYGNALGRYLGLNSFNDGYIAADGDIETIDQYGLVLAYRHFWAPEWRSSFSLSMSGASNPSESELAGAGLLARAYRSAHANLWYTPAPGLQLGGELIYGTKELEDGRDGSLSRLQLAVKYAF